MSSTPRSSTSSRSCRPLVSSTGIVCGKEGGFEADDFLAAAVAAERLRSGAALVATSDRDAFQLAAEDVTILQPVRGVSELRRIGPAEVRERYGVEPRQVPDFIALRGDPSDKIPGARGVGEKTAATLLQTFPDLDAMFAAGRFEAEAAQLRDFRHIATLDPTAPLPPVPDLEPDWDCRSARRGAARRGAPGIATSRGLTVEPVSHPAMAHLHPTGHHHHPEREARLASPSGRVQARARGRAREHRSDRACARPRICRPYRRPLRGVLARRRHARTADHVGGGAAGGGVLDQGRRGGRVRARAPARPSCAARRPDGLLHLRQCGHRRPLRAG